MVARGNSIQHVSRQSKSGSAVSVAGLVMRYGLWLVMDRELVVVWRWFVIVVFEIGEVDLVNAGMEEVTEQWTRSIRW